MKKLLIIAAAAVLLLAGGISLFGDTHASANKEDNPVQTLQTDDANENETNDLTNYIEYATLDSQIENITDYQAKVVTNNSNKRIILFSDVNTEQYKSIFIKDTDRLKIIDSSNGQIFNQVLGNTDNETKADKEGHTSENKSKTPVHVSDDLDDFPEFDTLEEAIDADDDDARIVEDNQHKRVMLVNGEENGKQYKSIFIKDTNRLKIIELDHGQVFNSIIK